ncbi:MAG: adenosylmethionine decarboxylase [Lentisphaeria bacterium]|nr:adenosylmethionine decarboxylase [Lentisphaeria bacterium]
MLISPAPAPHALGHQMMIEYYGCDADILNDPVRMEQIFLNAARTSGAHVISSHFHRFQPQGVSGIVVIAESHFAVHAWPEYGYAAVDIFTCGKTIDFQTAEETMRREMASKRHVVIGEFDRGLIPPETVE